jgi:hypothetical protein
MIPLTESHIAEIMLRQKLPGSWQIYDHHDYLPEQENEDARKGACAHACSIIGGQRRKTIWISTSSAEVFCSSRGCRCAWLK